MRERQSIRIIFNALKQDAKTVTQKGIMNEHTHTEMERKQELFNKYYFQEQETKISINHTRRQCYSICLKFNNSSPFQVAIDFSIAKKL